MHIEARSPRGNSRGVQGLGVVGSSWLCRALLSAPCVSKPSHRPMFGIPFLGTPLVPLKRKFCIFCVSSIGDRLLARPPAWAHAVPATWHFSRNVDTAPDHFNHSWWTSLDHTPLAVVRVSKKTTTPRAARMTSRGWRG